MKLFKRAYFEVFKYIEYGCFKPAKLRQTKEQWTAIGLCIYDNYVYIVILQFIYIHYFLPRCVHALLCINRSITTPLVTRLGGGKNVPVHFFYFKIYPNFSKIFIVFLGKNVTSAEDVFLRFLTPPFEEQFAPFFKGEGGNRKM